MHMPFSCFCATLVVSMNSRVVVDSSKNNLSKVLFVKKRLVINPNLANSPRNFWRINFWQLTFLTNYLELSISTVRDASVVLTYISEVNGIKVLVKNKGSFKMFSISIPNLFRLLCQNRLTQAADKQCTLEMRWNTVWQRSFLFSDSFSFVPFCFKMLLLLMPVFTEYLLFTTAQIISKAKQKLLRSVFLIRPNQINNLLFFNIFNHSFCSRLSRNDWFLFHLILDIVYI